MGESTNKEKYKEMFKRHDSDDLRQRRFESNFQVRKNRRELAVDKGRDIQEEDSLLDGVEKMELDDDGNDDEKTKKKSVIGDQWEKFLKSANVIDQRIGLSRISKAINKNTKKVVKELIKHNLFARIIQLLESHGERFIQVRSNQPQRKVNLTLAF